MFEITLGCPEFFLSEITRGNPWNFPFSIPFYFPFPSRLLEMASWNFPFPRLLEIFHSLLFWYLLYSTTNQNFHSIFFHRVESDNFGNFLTYFQFSENTDSFWTLFKLHLCSILFAAFFDPTSRYYDVMLASYNIWRNKGLIDVSYNIWCNKLVIYLLVTIYDVISRNFW